jgi:putative ribosome biogenesis GTPase RsgA
MFVQELGSLFPDFVAASEAAGGCRFGNCLHVAEPGCVVREDESLVERHKYYVKFLAEVKVE